MSNMVLFQNTGEIPVNAFKLLGASSKRGDASKIGFYGTGLKYAIALMLREDIKFKIYSGTKEVKITKRATKFLDQKIDVMVVNGEKTSITLDAGIDWEPWFAIREIYSNTMDESGEMKVNAEIEPQVGATKIYIDLTSESLKDIFENWNNYFTTSRTIKEEFKGGNILPKLPSNAYYTVFRKGIRAYSNRDKSLFDYDLKSLDINESRVAKYSWQTEQESSKLLAQSKLDTIEKFIALGRNTETRDYMEWQNSFWEYTGSNFSMHWLTAINGRKLIPNDFAGRYDHTEQTLVLPDKLIKRLKEAFGDEIHVVGQDEEEFVVQEMSPEDKEPLERSAELLLGAGLKFNKNNVLIAKFHDSSILGTVKKDNVILSDRLFSDQTEKLDAVLLEEVVHLKTGFEDSTRRMQDYLFDTIIYLIKHGRKVK